MELTSEVDETIANRSISAGDVSVGRLNAAERAAERKRLLKELDLEQRKMEVDGKLIQKGPFFEKVKDPQEQGEDLDEVTVNEAEESKVPQEQGERLDEEDAKIDTVVEHAGLPKRVSGKAKKKKSSLVNKQVDDDGGKKEEHKKSHAKEKNIECSICLKAFKSPAELRIHMRNHTGKKLFKCAVCQYSSITSHQLVKHTRKHTGEKPFKCDVCMYSTSESGSLITHKRKHTGEKPFKCDVCEYSTSRSGNLILHKRSHTGEKPFECDVCKYSASHSGNLKIHKRKHTGEKPFKCDVCQFSSSANSALISHMRKHTGEKPFQCKVCEFSSAFASDNNKVPKQLPNSLSVEDFSPAFPLPQFSDFMEGVNLEEIPADVIAQIERNRVVIEDELNDYQKKVVEQFCNFFSVVAQAANNLDDGFAFYVDLYGHVDATIRYAFSFLYFSQNVKFSENCFVPRCLPCSSLSSDLIKR